MMESASVCMVESLDEKVHEESKQETFVALGPEIDEKKLLRKLDIYLVPWLSVLYLLCFLDRTSIGNARLYGLEKDIGISDKEYLICLTVFFFPYALLEVPANICLKKFRPSVWISSTMLVWGIVMAVQGLVRNFAGLFAARWFLGIAEAGFFPAAAFYLSCWYKRDEIGARLAFFNAGVTIAGAFGGLLAAAISNMEGIAGKSAWSWIFILEGLMTAVLAVASFFILYDYPETATFLSEAEREFLIRRLQSEDRILNKDEGVRWRVIKKGFIEWKTWTNSISLMGMNMALLGLSLFLPSIIDELGFTATRSNLLTVPVFVAGCAAVLIIGFAADRYRNRGLIAVVLSTIAIIGYIILMASKSLALSYAATYIVAIGVYPNVPNNQAWIVNNAEGPLKKAVILAIATTCANLAGAVSSNVYRSRDAPRYVMGHGLTLLFVVISQMGAIWTHVMLKNENAARDRGERDELITGSGSSECDNRNGTFETIEEAKLYKGDEWSGFRYIT